MSGKRNVSVCRGHELANALYRAASFDMTRPKKSPLMSEMVMELSSELYRTELPYC